MSKEPRGVWAVNRVPSIERVTFVAYKSARWCKEYVQTGTGVSACNRTPHASSILMIARLGPVLAAGTMNSRKRRDFA